MCLCILSIACVAPATKRWTQACAVRRSPPAPARPPNWTELCTNGWERPRLTNLSLGDSRGTLLQNKCCSERFRQTFPLSAHAWKPGLDPVLLACAHLHRQVWDLSKGWFHSLTCRRSSPCTWRKAGGSNAAAAAANTVHVPVFFGSWKIQFSESYYNVEK